MAANNLYMPFHVGDYMADAGHLTVMEHGAYFLLICTYWQRGGPLPDDERKLMALTRMTPDQFELHWPMIVEFFERRDGLLHHKRIDAELQKARDRSSAAQRSVSQRIAKANRPKIERSSNDDRPMYDGSSNQDQVQEEAIASSADDAMLSASEIKRRLEQATGWTGLPGEGTVLELVKSGVSFEERVLPLAREEAGRRSEPPKSWAYIATVAKDQTRQPAEAAKPVETVWVPFESDAWKALAKVKKESWLRMLLRPDGRGGEGFFWPVRDLPKAKTEAA